MEVKTDLYYIQGHIKILDYIIEKNKDPENLKEELAAMYESSIESYQSWNTGEEKNGIKEEELRGATDILAWILDISQKEHKNNMKKGQIKK